MNQSLKPNVFLIISDTIDTKIKTLKDNFIQIQNENMPRSIGGDQNRLR